MYGLNETVLKTSDKSRIGWLLTETDLIDLQQYQFPHHPQPPTYNRGQLTIDVSLGSPEFVQALHTMALLPFRQPLTLRGNHQTLILEFDQKMLFGNKLLLTPFYTTWGTNSHSLPTMQKFCHLVTRAYNQSNILDNIAWLEGLPHFTEQDHQLMEDTDNELTKILIQANKNAENMPNHGLQNSIMHIWSTYTGY